MQASNIIQPTVLSTPVAVDGLKNTIPTNPTSSSSNLASITGGFPSITMKSVANGGLPPMGQDFNGLFYVATDQKVYLQNGGIITFNEDVSTAIGGYPNGAILDYLDSNNNFLKVQSLIDNNTYNFITTPSYIDGEHWQILNNGGANIDLSNLSDTGNDYINQSKALETGNVSSNPDVYADILKRAHSSFDLSKFTVVGSPTISEDGILTNYSTSDYLQKNVSISENEIIVKFSFNILKNIPTGVNSAIFRSSNTTANISIDVRNVSDKLYVASYLSDGTVNGYTSPRNKGSLALNTAYTAECIYNISNYTNTCKLYKDGILFDSATYKLPSALTNWTSITNFLIGQVNTAYVSIDLKSIAIWADGIPVFNGNITGTDTKEEIEIPYTLSANNSKIVDVAYRDKVQELYAKTGEALYYTIDEQNQNFTLPSADIYGIITKNRDIAEHADLATQTAYIVEKSDPSLLPSWFRVWSDGWIEQGGRINTTSENQQVTVNLLKPFSNTNYCIQGTQQRGSNSASSYPRISSIGTSNFNLVGDSSAINLWSARGY